MKLFELSAILQEALSNRKAAPGSVPFSTSSLQDPWIVKSIKYISTETGIPEADIIKRVNAKVAEMTNRSKLAPALYQTMLKNAVESEVFGLIWNGVPTVDDTISGLARQMGFEIPTKKVGQKPVSTQFSDRTFMQLVRFIKADHDEFFPLRGFVDRRVLENEQWVILPNDNYKQYASITTAAATPSGIFMFDRHFCQKLIDYGELKGLKGNGKKYVSQGGPIPDSYAYIEFLIMHELMHFSNDDFYYQHIIPNANGTIINWVGDFRSNYLLVKSGYAQLPMGLYNDAINYDRQSEYTQMYRIVEEEFNKLNPNQQKQVQQDMDGHGDDHGPGQEEGAKPGSRADVSGKTTKDIDKNAERVEGEAGESSDSEEEAKPGQGKGGGTGNGGENKSSGSTDANAETNYQQYKPSVAWGALVKKFVASASPKTQETYAKPHKRAATAADLLRQQGAAAVKPAEKPAEHADITLMFVVDASGSMMQAIGKAFASINALLKQPQFRKSDVIVMRFSNNFDIHKGNMASNKAAKVKHVDEKPTVYDKTMQQIFNTTMGGGTDFSTQVCAQIEAAIAKKYNVLLFSDTDMLYGSNNKNMVAMIKKYPKNMYVLFDSERSYIAYRQSGGPATPQVTHM